MRSQNKLQKRDTRELRVTMLNTIILFAGTFNRATALVRGGGSRRRFGSQDAESYGCLNGPSTGAAGPATH